MILRWQGAMAEQVKAGLDSLGVGVRHKMPQTMACLSLVLSEVPVLQSNCVNAGTIFVGMGAVTTRLMQ